MTLNWKDKGLWLGPAAGIVIGTAVGMTCGKAKVGEASLSEFTGQRTAVTAPAEIGDYPTEPIQESHDEETEPCERLGDIGNSTFSLYDDRITEYTNQWNKEFKDVPGFTPLDPNLAKAVLIQESGDHPDTAYVHDPMQVANRGDFALKVLRDGKEASVPKGGYRELHGIVETPGRWVKYKTRKGKKRKKWVWDYGNGSDRITPDLSIEYGIRWLFQKSFVFDKYGKVSGMRPWKSAVKRYNGGGDKKYTKKVYRIRNALN